MVQKLIHWPAVFVIRWVVLPPANCVVQLSWCSSRVAFACLC